jgi:phosphopentomutase
MACASPAKDTTAGHWELAGIILDKPFPVYPNGFPSDVIKEFEKKIGTKIIGNTTASGTEIISRLGDEHCRTGYPIVYTSADSVFQIAAHEQVFGLEKLYKICAIARQMLTGKHAVGRVIARPFTGTSGNYSRTLNRRDYSLTPSEPTILDRVKDIQGSVIGVGKIEDIFNKAGITKAIHTSSNREGFLATLELVKKQVSSGAEQRTIIFSNLVDFDMHWGHRRDTEAYAKGLKEFDNWLPELLAALKEEDVLIITADHGCDPTFKKHTDHTREYVPLIVCGKKINSGVDLGVRKSFADVAQTIADAFRLKPMTNGVSFARELGIS